MKFYILGKSGWVHRGGEQYPWKRIYWRHGKLWEVRYRVSWAELLENLDSLVEVDVRNELELRDLVAVMNKID